ncbi:hypothetical protein PtA15_5A851 [Puccinia triticina]|uniref:Uncharacterized protein n=1 Tax=Puccinia triticina TaxID=208348 RepID=A0ABY7CJ68_9BASI|nr:uncharacterized protein PtA15_5A851 [Puccinia triticina]WAQ85276.1 hypothetical protein PtA15_5A851 [Puccinia triticina]
MVLACDGRTGEQREIGYTGTHVVGNGKSVASFSSSYPSSPQPYPPCNPARPTPTGQDWDWNLVVFYTPTAALQPIGLDPATDHDEKGAHKGDHPQVALVHPGIDFNARAE